MRVSAVQFKPPKGDLPSARARLVRLAMRAAQDSDLVVLPEMSVSGYVFPDADSVRPAAERPDGPTYRALAPIARASGAWIVAGFAEDAGDRLFNSALIIDPRGALHAVYRKTLLFENDETWASPGDSGYLRIVTDAGAFGVGICMDLNDDRFVNWCASADLKAIAFPTNWLATDSGIDVWHYWAWRMDAVPATLVAANTYGLEAGILFCGRSAIMHGWRVLAAAPPEGDGIIRAVL